MGRTYIGGSYAGKSGGSFRSEGEGDITPFIIAAALIIAAVTPLFFGIKWPIVALALAPFAGATAIVIYIFITVIITVINGDSD